MATNETETGINKVTLNYGGEYDATMALKHDIPIWIPKEKSVAVTRDGCRVIISGELTGESLSKVIGVINLGWLLNHPNYESFE